MTRDHHPRATGCSECIGAHPIDEPTDCNCDCGHTEVFVSLGGTWYEVEALDHDNPYTRGRDLGQPSTSR